MIYAAATFWLTVIVLLAWGVYTLWTALAKPKTVNAVLLPGTLIAQLGRIVGLLITGATVNNTALMKNDEKGGPATDPNPQPRIPVIGPVIVAMLPMLALGGMIYLVVGRLGAAVMAQMPQEHMILQQVPTTLTAFWDQLRSLITLAERTLQAVRTAEIAKWKIAAFVYLMVCLTVRMSPLPGNIRGHIGATVTLGIIAWLAGTMSATLPGAIERGWPLLSLAVGWLILLMMFSLFVRGAVSAAQMIFRPD